MQPASSSTVLAYWRLTEARIVSYETMADAEGTINEQYDIAPLKSVTYGFSDIDPLGVIVGNIEFTWNLTTGAASTVTTGTVTGFQFLLGDVDISDLAPVITPPPLPGDYNIDGSVDAADYVVWRNGLGTTYTPDDYNVWRTNFGRTVGSGTATHLAASDSQAANSGVPEPASHSLLLLAAVCSFFVRRRPHRIYYAYDPGDTAVRRYILIHCLSTAMGFILSTEPALAIGTTPPSWKPRETVTSTLAAYTAMIGADRSLAYDHHGNPGIAFFEHVFHGLRYARRVPGAGWVHAVIDTGFSTGSYPSLAYDRYERPAISYHDRRTDGDLKYAHLSGSAWLLETVDITGNMGDHTSLAFDLLGQPAIAYHDNTNTSLKYVQDTDGDFSLIDETPVTVVNQFDEGHWASLVFDPWNRPMITHWDFTNSDLRFSVQEPGIGWVTATVDSTLTTGWYPSIAIDPDTGFPSIAYYDTANTALRYAAWDGDAWNLTTLDGFFGIDAGEYPSLAFDPADGNPAIAYYDRSFGNLKLAWHDGSIWRTQTVDSVGNVGLSPSLAFNNYGSGFPSIAYFNDGVGGTGQLFFIEDPPAVPEPASVMLLAIGLSVAGTLRVLSARRNCNGHGRLPERESIP
jgi:hypothetical protein